MMDLKMEVYTQSLELIGILEVHRSIIWEENAFSSGSFSVDSIITSNTSTMLQPENIIWIEGETAGIIEYVKENADESGPYITVKGRTLTGILNRRVLWGLYNLSGTVPEIMHALVDDCCVNPTRGDVDARKIPGLVLLDTPAGGETIQLQKTGGYLLDVLQSLGETYGVSFGVRFNPAVPQMEFWTRWGENRTIYQDANNPILYSTELDDVLSSEYLYNSQDYRNVALVAGEGDGSERVYVTVENEAEEPDTPIPPMPPGPTPVTKYTVTLLVDPEGGGTVSGGKTVAAGLSVTVTAAPADGYTFSGWQENGVTVSNDMSYTFKVDRDRTLTAVFAVIIRTVVVTVNIDPPGGGSVVGGGSYEYGQLVTLTQTPGSIYRFSGWYSSTGQQLETGDKYTFTASEDVTITAKYAELPMYSISATVDPSGAGTVTGAGQYKQGETVSLTATANDGYAFTDWKEGGTTVHNGPDYTFTAEKNRDLVAAFEQKKTSRLPAGYTELEYIQSSGTQYINTGRKPTSTIKLTMDIEPTVAATSTIKYFCSSYYLLNGTGYYFQLRWNSGLRVCTGNIVVKTVSSDATPRRMTAVVDYPNKIAYIEGESEVAITALSIHTAMQTLTLLGPATGSNGVSARLYYAKLEDADTVSEYIPCINPSGKIGLYDIIGGAFYGNAGTGAVFTAGPAVYSNNG